jgi:hypothetical protein
MESGTGASDDPLRHEALASLKKKEAFRSHLYTYLGVNALLIVIWAATGADFFWPIFPIAGWGIAVAGQAWDAYRRKPITEDDVQAEAERLRARGTAVQDPGEPGKGKQAP